MTDQCRWGILGAANIARKLWSAIKSSGSGRVVAVASREKARAASFIESCQAQRPMVDETGKPVAVDAVAGYDALLARDDIDAVYIPLPTAARSRWVIASAIAGKHVLCEKPAAVHLETLYEMIRACRSANVQWMDGVMFDHSARIGKVAELCRNGELGELRRIECHFSFLADAGFEDQNIRSNSELEPHGALGDLGWYGIRFTDHILGGRLPSRVRCTIRKTVGDGVPSECLGQIETSDGLPADIFCSFHCVNRQTAMVTGTTGYVSLDDFVLPMTGGQSRWQVHRNDLQIDGGRWTFDRRTEFKGVDEPPSELPGSQEVNMVQTMNELCTSGQRDRSFESRSLRTQSVMDAMRSSGARGGEWVTPEAVD